MPIPHVKIVVEPERYRGELTTGQRRALEAALPPGRVSLDPQLRADYGRDESPVFPAVPAAVVFVASAQEVASVLAICSRERIPVTPRGAGSGKVGGAIPLYGGVVLALEKMNGLLDIDGPNRLARVSPGIITGSLRTQAEQAGLFYPVDPNSLDWCSIGGNVAANAAGPASMKYGATRNQVLGLEVVLADGEILKLGRQTTKCSTGYDLCSLITGSEGTLAVVTEVTVRLLARPASVRTLFATFATATLAIEALTDLYHAGITPCAAEFFDAFSLEAIRDAIHIPEGAGAGLLFELDGSEHAIDEMLEMLVNVLGDRARDVIPARDEAHRRRLWDARKLMSIKVKAQYKRFVTEDVAVPPGRLPQLVDFIERTRERTGLALLCYGHAGDGNLHVNFLYQEEDEHSAIEAAVEAVFREVIRLGGTLSGEHGIGASKRRFMGLEQSEGLLSLQRRLKKTLDPHGILNPGKVFPE